MLETLNAAGEWIKANPVTSLGGLALVYLFWENTRLDYEVKVKAKKIAELESNNEDLNETIVNLRVDLGGYQREIDRLKDNSLRDHQTGRDELAAVPRMIRAGMDDLKAEHEALLEETKARYEAQLLEANTEKLSLRRELDKVSSKLNQFIGAASIASFFYRGAVQRNEITAGPEERQFAILGAVAVAMDADAGSAPASP